MKFYCDSCNTKYAISDDKVRGKVLKVKCKHCGNVITVRELAPVASPPKPPAIPSTQIPQTNWHFSINGQSTGPMGLASLKARYATGEIGDETYVWHDTFDGWKPVASVAIFDDALARGQALKPRTATVALTGITDAVEEIMASTERKGVAPKSYRKRDAASIEEEARKSSPLGSRPLNEDRMEKLRSKLLPSKLDKPKINPLPIAKKAEDPGVSPALPKVEKPFKEAKPLAQTPVIDEPQPSFFPEPIEEAQIDFSAFSPTLPDSLTSVDPIAKTELPENVNSGFFEMEENAPFFEMEENAPFSLPDKPVDLFAPEAATYGTDNDDSDIMPFFPEGASLNLGDDEPSEIFASSKSLLIELDKIKKTDRKKSVVFLLAGLFIFLLLGGVGTYMYLNREIEEIAKVEKVEEREAKIISYKKSELAAKFVQLDDEVIPSNVDIEGEGKGKGENEAPKKKKSEEKKSLKGTKVAQKEKIKKTIAKTPNKKESAGLSSEEELRKKLLAIGSTSPIKRPEDMLGSASKNKPGLSRVQAQAGFKKVSRSVATCRQRHANRSGKELQSAKVKISVEVLPSGKVSSFRISPGELRHTAFDSCMKSKKETWRFASFGGKPVKINRTFILQ